MSRYRALRQRMFSAVVLGIGLILAAGVAAALANFVSPFLAALLGLASGAAGFGGSLVLQRRLKRRDLLADWDAVIVDGPGTETRTSPRAVDDSPFVLLNADRSPVRFSEERSADLRRLMSWDDRHLESGVADPPGPWWLVEAPAGRGKTRFLLEACNQLKAIGWVCGWARSGSGGSVLRVATRWRRPVLVIVDDVDTRTDLFELLVDLAGVADREIYVVLAAREFGQWWADLRARLDADLVRMLRRPGRTFLDALTDDTEARQQLFDQATRAFARHLGVPITHSRFTAAGSVELLPLHAAALMAADGQYTGEISIDEAIAQLFDSEEAWWGQRAAGQGRIGQLGITPLRSAVVLAVLCGACSLNDACRLLRHVPGLAKAGDSLLSELAHWLREIYPQRHGEWLNPHLPAVLAERYAVMEILEVPALADAVVAAAGAHPHRVLAILAKSARHSPAAAEVALIELISRAPARLLGPAIEVALLHSASIDEALAEATRRATQLAESDLEGLLSIESDSEVIPRTGLELASRHLAFARTSEIRAARLLEVGTRCRRLELYDEALVAHLEAVELLGATVDGGTSADLPVLARAWNGVGATLGLMGRHLEALDAHQCAMEIWESLVEVNPVQYSADVAHCLGKLSAQLNSLGRNDEALAIGAESIGLWRLLAEGDPDAHDGNLASALERLSAELRVRRDNEMALVVCREAIEIRRRRSAILPKEHTWSLACSLTFLTGALSALGHHGEALVAIEEAVGIMRKHADMHPTTRRGSIAICLAQFADVLSHNTRDEEALAVAQESVSMIRRLALERPEAWAPMLAGGIDNIGNYLQRLGRFEEAIRLSEKAIDMFEILSAQRPDAMKRHLDIAVRNLHRRQRAAGILPAE